MKIRNNDEIDFIDIFLKIWSKRFFILKTITVCVFIGIVFLFFTPKEYESEITVLVESKDNSNMSGIMQQFGGLAGLSGLKSSNTEILPQDLYPTIIASTPFLIDILNSKIEKSQPDSNNTLKYYFEEKIQDKPLSVIIDYSIGLPNKIFSYNEKKSKSTIAKQIPYNLSRHENNLINSLKNRISAEEGENENTIKIKVKMQDPQLAANLIDTILNQLTFYIVDYKTQKQKNNLDFLLERQFEAEKKLKEAQYALATYRDKNKNIILASVQSSEQFLQSNYDIAFNVYNNLSIQVEQAKLKVKENTPVFKIIEPAKVPISKSSPKTIATVFTMVVIGIIISLLILSFRKIYIFLFNLNNDGNDY